MSENGVTCVFVVHFRPSDAFKSLSTGLTVNIHVSTKTCVTGNNFILHKALLSLHISSDIFYSWPYNSLKKNMTHTHKHTHTDARKHARTHARTQGAEGVKIQKINLNESSQFIMLALLLATTTILCNSRTINVPTIPLAGLLKYISVLYTWLSAMNMHARAVATSNLPFPQGY